MPRCKSKQCSPLVRQAFNTIHTSCGSKQPRNGTNKTGLFLNKHSPLIKFEEVEEYYVCYNLATLFKRKRVTECIPCVDIPVALPPDPELPVAETREDRRRCRAIIASQEGLKRTIVELNSRNEMLVNDVKRRMMRKEKTVVSEAVVEEEDGEAPAILNVTEDAGAGEEEVPEVILKKAKKNTRCEI